MNKVYYPCLILVILVQDTSRVLYHLVNLNHNHRIRYVSSHSDQLVLLVYPSSCMNIQAEVGDVVGRNNAYSEVQKKKEIPCVEIRTEKVVVS